MKLKSCRESLKAMGGKRNRMMVEKRVHGDERETEKGYGWLVRMGNKVSE